MNGRDERLLRPRIQGLPARPGPLRVRPERADRRPRVGRRGLAAGCAVPHVGGRAGAARPPHPREGEERELHPIDRQGRGHELHGRGGRGAAPAHVPVLEHGQGPGRGPLPELQGGDEGDAHEPAPRRDRRAQELVAQGRHAPPRRRLPLAAHGRQPDPAGFPQREPGRQAPGVAHGAAL